MSNGIAFAGGMGVGKTTAADILVEEHGFVKIGFATPLYALADIHRRCPEGWLPSIYAWAEHTGAGELLGARLTEFADRALSVFEDTPVFDGKNRTLLQLLGTEVGRTLKPTLWIELFEKAALDAMGAGRRVVNDNLRFANELASCKRVGLTPVFIAVPEDVQDARYLATYGVARTPKQKTHASEQELAAVRSGCDLVFINDGTIEDLRGYVRFLVENAKVEA